jgi:hypothetical protein
MRSVFMGLGLLGALVIGSGCLAGETPEGAEKRLTNGDFERHITALKRRLPPGDFTILVQSPFVVIGDEPASVVRRRANDTVKWAVERLKREYFKRDPQEILDIWLFKDEESYNRNARLLFGETPSTPFGYYSPSHKSLVMNIATGGGTLVHEIVHPFVEANFPDCPPWFNEGLGSLYEQCSDKDGRINGATNWRLAGLQRAIRTDRVPPFADLLAMDHTAFYERDRGTNYGQARYLCYYLQEKGLLAKFYKDFTASSKTDPTGVKTLKKILGTDDLAAFKKSWETFVLKLTFP